MSRVPFDTPEERTRTESTRPSTEAPVPAVAPASAAGTVSAEEVASRLVLVRGPQAGTGFAVTEAHTTIGRDHGCDIVLEAPTVSRFHAEIDREGGRYVLTDSGSLNGTYLNRRPMDRAVLADGDEVWIGTFHFTFRSGLDQ